MKEKMQAKKNKIIGKVKKMFCKIRRVRPADVPKVFKRLFRKIAGVHYFHWILIAAVLGSVALTVFHYRLSLTRIGQAFGDFVDSIAVYFKVLFSADGELPEGMTARIAELPQVNLKEILPFDVDEIGRRLKDMWACVFKKDYIVAYFAFVFRKLYHVTFYGLIVIELLVILWILFRSFLFKENERRGDTGALAWWRKYPGRAAHAVKLWVMSFLDFFKNSYYPKILKYIWLVNFNLVTIAVEAVAFYLFFVSTFSFKSLFVQVVRLLVDALIMLFSTPFAVWLVVGYAVLDIMRRNIGMRILRSHEAANCAFLDGLPVVSMILGTMGTGKTTMLTDAGLSQQNIFRTKAKELLFKADLKFPEFPWQRFEDALRGASKHHVIAYSIKAAKENPEEWETLSGELSEETLAYWECKSDRGIWSLASCKKFMERKRAQYEACPSPHRLFGYDISRYGGTCDDKLTVSELWDTLTDYAKLFYLYSVDSPLIMSNYSVRSDAAQMSVGNFPEWDMDFFSHSTEDSAKLGKNAHIVDFDTLRLGNLVNPENPKRGSFEFGAVLLSEIGKERGNMVENRGKKRTDEEANSLNDGFNSRLKMSRHAAVVANYPFIKIYADEQRAESWGADARDLCKLVTIEKRSATKLALPFFSLEGLIYEILYPRFRDFYYKLRYTRGDTTLFGYLVKKAFCMYHNHCSGIINTFGYATLTIDLKDGRTDGDGEGEKSEYFLSFKKIYSNRFSTDCYADLFEAGSLEASTGLDDYAMYTTTRASWDEMESQNSYFVRELTRQFRVKATPTDKTPPEASAE